MAITRYPFEENTRVLWVPDAVDIADITGPTTGELNDGDTVDITCFLTADGLNPGGTTNKVDGATLCDKLDAQTIGSVGYDMSLTGYRDKADGGDTFWDLANWGDLGFIVIRRGIAHDDAWANGQAVEVYDVQLGEPVMAGSARNTNQTFTVGAAVEAAEIKAVVGGIGS